MSHAPVDARSPGPDAYRVSDGPPADDVTAMDDAVLRAALESATSVQARLHLALVSPAGTLRRGHEVLEARRELGTLMLLLAPSAS